MSSTVIISDLHLDTWSEDELGPCPQTKKRHFLGFLDACEDAGIRELVINGDLMDFPPYESQCPNPDEPSIAQDVLKRLAQFAERVPVVYVFGNHDMGISGLRCLGGYDIPLLKHFRFLYPGYSIDHYAQSTVLIEHGHLVDPMLFAYVAKLAEHVVTRKDVDSFFWGLQRRDLRNPTKQKQPGVFPPIEVEANAGFEETVRRAAQRSGGCLSVPWPLVSHLTRRLTSRPKKEYWWISARMKMEAHISAARDNGRPIKPLLYHVFGHTHRADIREHTNQRDKVFYTYMNPGTWAGDTPQGPYLVVNEDGKMRMHDWINEPGRALESLRH